MTKKSDGSKNRTSLGNITGTATNKGREKVRMWGGDGDKEV